MGNILITKHNFLFGALLFISGFIVCSMLPDLHVYAAIENLYQTSNPPLPKEGDLIDANCDFWGQHCQQVPITDDQREAIFDDWCYSIENQYHTGKTTQYFRTMSHDCTAYIIDEKLKHINEKLDKLTNELEVLKK